MNGSQPAEAVEPGPAPRLWERAAFSTGLLVVAGLFFRDSLRLSSSSSTGVGPEFIPRVMSVMLFALAVLYALPLLREGYRRRGAPSAVPKDTQPPPGTGRLVEHATTALARARETASTYVVLTGIYVFLIDLLGFFVSLSLFMLAVSAAARIRPWWKVALLTIGMDLFCYLGFTLGLNIIFPSGLLM